MKLWLVLGGGNKIIAGCGLWQGNYGWSLMVVGGDSKIMTGFGLSWMVVAGRRWSHDLVMPKDYNDIIMRI